VIERGDIFRSGALATLIPPAPAERDAQTSNKGGPLNIRHIRRGHAFASLTGRASNISVTSTSWAEPSTVLAFTLNTSERPLMIESRVRAGASSGTIYLTLLIDGIPVTPAKNGLCSAGSTALHLCPLWVASPGQGTHRISLAAKVSTSGSGTIHCVDDVAVLTAREV
jgi:hypothetical protein